MKQILFRLTLTLLLLATPMVGALAAETPRLLFPADRSFLTLSSVRVIGLAAKGQETVPVTIEGGRLLGPNPVPVTKGAFSFEVRLAAGTNRILLAAPPAMVGTGLTLFRGSARHEPPEGFSRYFLHAGLDAAESCAECHLLRRSNDYRRIKPERSCTTVDCHDGFATATSLHGPVASGSCAACHNPHGSSLPHFVSREPPTLCFDCHSENRERFTGAVTHQPVAKGACLVCHDPHQSETGFQLKKESQASLCASCHGNERSEQPHLHGPVATGQCVACHNPHASDHPNLLYEPRDEICFLCHRDRQAEFSRPFVHEPAKQGCHLCHDPHGSQTRFHLRSSLTLQAPGQTAPCLSCHRRLDPELTEQILTATVPHDPVVKGECTACHTPHASEYPHQLKAPLKQICFACHLEMGDRVAESSFKHGPVVSNDCASCHRVHGSDHAHLLVEDFPEEFYTPYATDKYGVCFDCHNERVALDKWSKETQFRNGNRNLHYVHVNRVKGRSCKACHEVHAGNQGRHIRADVPFGSRGWSYPVEFTPTETGGSCMVGCHRPMSYDRENKIKN